MLFVYIATLAPGVTFWDAGEFISAARVLGIPHPPGTPLFVVLLNVWARAFPFWSYAAATNLLSAACTAASLGLIAFWLARGTNASWMAAGAAVAAGTMSSVWLNATETEVYAASLFLAVAAMVSADQAGRSGETRWRTLTAYCLALSIPLHLSALVAAPVVVYLASARLDGGTDWNTAAMLSGVTLFVVGVSKLSVSLTGLAVVIVVAASLIRGRRTALNSIGSAAAMIITMAVACSAVMILLVRARHDPAINQANPSSMRDLAYVVARQQYDVAGLWPRQAPWWLQLANWFEYADWQVALTLAPTVIPSVPRVLATVSFAALGMAGARWHYATDRRTWRAVLLLLICGTLGVIAYVNLKAGTSFAWSFLPKAEQHEARDRDYFFVLGFLAWGIWAGAGAMALAAKWRLPRIAGLGVAALPLFLNWAAVSRRAEPEASLPRELAIALLDPLPRNTVLFVAGDNDTYPLWYVQQVERRRRDVAVVTMPLLGAPWYPAEFERRYGLLGGDTADGSIDLRSEPVAARIARRARTLGRPVAAALTLTKAERDQIGGKWVSQGLVALDARGVDPAALTTVLDSGWSSIPIARAPAESLARTIERWQRGRVARPSTDPVYEYFSRVLSCPRLSIQRAHTPAQVASLDSLCNLR